MLDQIQPSLDPVESDQDAGDILLLPQDVPLQGMQLLPDADELVPNRTLPLFQIGHVALHAPEDFEYEIFGFGHGGFCRIL